MNPVTAIPPEQLKARARIAGMKRQAALERLRKARWAFDKNPNESTLADLRMWTITVLQHEHEMCGFALEMDARSE